MMPLVDESSGGTAHRRVTGDGHARICRASGSKTPLGQRWGKAEPALRGRNFAGAEQKLPPISPHLKLYCARHTFAADMSHEFNAATSLKNNLSSANVL